MFKSSATVDGGAVSFVGTYVGGTYVGPCRDL